MCPLEVENPMKFEDVARNSLCNTLRFWHGFDLIVFEILYLRAQMELEGVLWCKVRLRELVGAVG